MIMKLKANLKNAFVFSNAKQPYKIFAFCEVKFFSTGINIAGLFVLISLE